MKTALQRIENIYIKYIDQKKKNKLSWYLNLPNRTKYSSPEKLLIRIRESQ